MYFRKIPLLPIRNLISNDKFFRQAKAEGHKLQFLQAVVGQCLRYAWASYH
jgi:hypothetical protein